MSPFPNILILIKKLIIGWEVRGYEMRPPRPPLMGGSSQLGSWEYRGMPSPSKNGSRSRLPCRVKNKKCKNKSKCMINPSKLTHKANKLKVPWPKIKSYLLLNCEPTSLRPSFNQKSVSLMDVAALVNV